MISEENKFKFVNDEEIKLGSGITIRARYECCADWQFGSLFAFCDKVYTQPHASIMVFFDKTATYGAWCDQLFMSKSYDWKPQFTRQGFEYAFDNLPEVARNELIEYCDWIVSEDGREYVANLLKLRIFM